MIPTERNLLQSYSPKGCDHNGTSSILSECNIPDASIGSIGNIAGFWRKSLILCNNPDEYSIFVGIIASV